MAALALPAVASAAATAGPAWAGTWATNRGPLELVGDGSAVSGTYGYADSDNDPIGQLTGVFSGATLAGIWSFEKTDFAPLDHGTFTLGCSVVNGEALFAGKSVYVANGTVVDWSGSCTAGACAADLTPPAVKALAAVGAAGTLVALRYSLFDDSTKASETITVTRNGAAVWRKAQPQHGATVAGGTFGVAWKAPAQPGAGVWRFTVEARDAAGNAARSSAAIRLR